MNGNQNNLEELIARREVMKGSIVNFTEFLDQFDKGNVGEFTLLQVRLTHIQRIFAQFHELCDGIDQLTEARDIREERFNIYVDFLNVCKRANLMFQEASLLHPDSVVLITPQTSEPSTRSVENTSNFGELVEQRPRRFKLRTPEITPFDGDMTKWLSFRDTFKRIVDDDPSATSAEKLFHLKACLTKSALKKISWMDTTDVNYAKAWQIIENAYHNPNHLITKHFQTLLTLPKQGKEQSLTLEELADSAQQSRQCLESLGIVMAPEIVTAILRECLNEKYLEKWKRETKGKEYPSLDQMTTFLYTETNITDESKSSNRSRNSGPPPLKMRRVENNTRAFVTHSSQPKQCIGCGGGIHNLSTCDGFKGLTIKERFDLISNAKFCRTCLFPHLGKPCRSSGCNKCHKKNHHTLLHFNKNSDGSKKESSK